MTNILHFRIPFFAATVAAGFMLFGAVSAEATPLTGYKVKWSQTPDMEQGVDYLSMHRSLGPVVADDFMSNGKPIAGFHWWGSYFSDEPDLQGGDRQVSFEISFHTDCPAGSTATGCDNSDIAFSHPNASYTAVIVDAEESLFGTTAGGENVYEYWALLPTPWEETAGNIYWVDIAWNAANCTTFGIDPCGDIWGWHESDQHWNDNAVQTAAGGPANPHIGPWTTLTGVDMAFEVLAVPEPASLALFGVGLAGLGFLRHRRKT